MSDKPYLELPWSSSADHELQFYLCLGRIKTGTKKNTQCTAKLNAPPDAEWSCTSFVDGIRNKHQHGNHILMRCYPTVKIVLHVDVYHSVGNSGAEAHVVFGMLNNKTYNKTMSYTFN